MAGIFKAIQKYPEHRRTQIAFVGALAVTAVVVVLWGFSLGARFETRAQESATVKKTTDTEAPGPIKALISGLSASVNGIFSREPASFESDVDISAKSFYKSKDNNEPIGEVTQKSSGIIIEDVSDDENATFSGKDEDPQIEPFVIQ